jgi:nucleoside-diphosphate-sugar epimerase
VKILLFGATGMVGAGALLECLADPRVESVLAIGRSPTGRTHPKLREVIRADFFRYDDLPADFATSDACFFCLGVSSVGMSEAAYTRLTYDLTLAAARAMVAGNPRLTFCYVTGAGTDSSEQGRTMWARVKGRTENAQRQRVSAAPSFRLLP